MKGFLASARGLPRPARRAGARELTSSGALRVPAVIGVLFWIIKALSTAMGESTSDYLVHQLGPVPAVLSGSSRSAVRSHCSSRGVGTSP